MFKPNETTGAIEMHAGDTGAIRIEAELETGDPWTSADRMKFSVESSAGVVMLERYYRLDTAAGNGVAIIMFHNDDTDGWAPGIYQTQWRYYVNPRWDGTAPTGDVTDALAEGVARIIEGDVVRIPEADEAGGYVGGQSTLTIRRVYGRGD